MSRLPGHPWPAVAQVFNLCAAPLGAAHAHRRTLTTAFQAILFGTRFAQERLGNPGRLKRVAR